MVAEVFASLSAIKSAFDIAKGLKDIHDVAARDRAVIELQKEILTAQQEQATLISRVSELEKEVTRLKDWEADKARYELAEISLGIVALSIKESMRKGEPFHRICADCAANGKKFYLQQYIRGPYYDEFRCHGCKVELAINKGNPPTHSIDDDGDWQTS
jgi:hypothetical protein